MKNHLNEEDGLTLIESMMAVMILLIGLLTMAQILTLGVVASKNLGRDTGKTAALARAQMEQLAALPFTSTSLASGADYPNSNGTIGASSGDYTRTWTVSDMGSTKKIVVTVTKNKSFQYGRPPSTVMVTEIAAQQ